MTLARIAALTLLLGAPAAALAEPPPATTGPVDGLVSSPANFKLLLENDHVRVLQYTLLPGTLDHWHTHPPRVGYVLSDAKIRVTEADGSKQDYDEKTGDIYWGEFSPFHDTFNSGTTPYIALLVEVKGAPSATSDAAMSASTQASDIAAIRALREQNNRALAAHDLEGAMQIVGKDFVLVGGNSGIDRSREEDRKAWAEEFAVPGHDRYVRTPARIEVGQRKGVWRAAESDTWEGIDHFAAGDSRPWGSYFVHWSKATGEWKVVAETYVTLGCRGPGC
jgi:ketosteroid isomerase-like protein/quercetin dioxygenase-like cupin family protein